MAEPTKEDVQDERTEQATRDLKSQYDQSKGGKYGTHRNSKKTDE